MDAPMLTMRRILFATDFSDLARQAGRLAARMARHFGARLLVVHVRPAMADGPDTTGLVSAVADLAPGLSVTTETLFGAPAQELVAYARRAGIDLIVMGTHGRTGVSRALLGSVAEAVVRRAPCPVLTVPAETTSSAVVEEPSTTVLEHCIVCATPATELICERCRTLIRGEALEAKLSQERPGRRGAPR
jgi:nucleotide-binding universal stress UspA family protein